MKKEITSVGIQQLSIAYDAIEDRLIFKIGMSNESELSVWLTRRITHALLKLLNNTPLVDYYEPKEKSETVETDSSESNKKNIYQKQCFTTEHQEKSSVQLDSIMLVHECQLLTSEGDHPITLELQCAKNQSLKFKLNDELIMAFVNMLQHANQQASWHFLSEDLIQIPTLAHTSYSLH
ncbi:MAG: hypothetical protein KAG10_05830 [Methylococcales bacterium]|nr:hypothetical protein [Methylococcales bacterium]MCK5925392.1 hypothetical protein [Methylococcales bacterium]